MATKYKIHPAIGIARVGDSPTSFYLAPEGPGRLPIDCDENGVTQRADGKEATVTSFRDSDGLLRRQGARFRVYVYADDNDKTGHEVAIGETLTVVYWKTGQTLVGTLRDIQWTAYIANKKSVWYEFKETDGEHGYAADHPLRNADITDATARQALIIDPGPVTVSTQAPRASFAKTDRAGVAQTFPPPLSPCSIDTLGDVLVTTQPETKDGKAVQYNRLVLLGGAGSSGSFKKGPSDPQIKNFANNDGWFDDEADGFVKASLLLDVQTINGKPPVNQGTSATIPVDEHAWVIVGYPRYAPQLVDIVTMDEAMYDVFVRDMAYDTDIYGVPPFDGSKPPPTGDALTTWKQNAEWNTDYYPRFWRDIWPILRRPQQYQYVMDRDPTVGGNPHATEPRGNLDLAVMSQAPFEGQDPVVRAQNAKKRRFIYSVLRKPGQENLYRLPPSDPDMPNYRLPGMPLLCGDNPLSNTAASKFLRLTDTMLFLLKQWADGKFINEKTEGIPLPDLEADPVSGTDLDRGVLGNLLGGAFCPGAETTWIVRNPAIYAKPYRVKLSTAMTTCFLSQTDNLAVGLEPGDLTKRNAVPWQADFNECATQPIDITYAAWSSINPASVGDPVVPIQQLTYWWPTHRPMYVNQANGGQVFWSGNLPTESTGDLAMVTAWKDMGFVCDFSYQPDPVNEPSPVLVEGWNSIPPIKTSSGGMS